MWSVGEQQGGTAVCCVVCAHCHNVSAIFGTMVFQSRLGGAVRPSLAHGPCLWTSFASGMQTSLSASQVFPSEEEEGRTEKEGWLGGGFAGSCERYENAGNVCTCMCMTALVAHAMVLCFFELLRSLCL